MLLNQEKADSRSFLETFQGKRNDESSLAASAPMHDYETISLVFNGVKRLPAPPPPPPPPSKDSGVACQIWTSRNLVLFIKKTTIIVWIHFLSFIYLSHTYQDSFRIASLSKEFRRYVNIAKHGASSLPPLPSWYSQKKTFGGGVRSASQNADSIYVQNLWFLSYFYDLKSSFL